MFRSYMTLYMHTFGLDIYFNQVNASKVDKDNQSYSRLALDDWVSLFNCLFLSISTFTCLYLQGHTCHRAGSKILPCHHTIARSTPVDRASCKSCPYHHTIAGVTLAGLDVSPVTPWNGGALGALRNWTGEYM